MKKDPEAMDEASIVRYITSTFSDIHSETADGATFFFNGPERKFPFATIVTKDNDYDRSSNLDRKLVFRLNISTSRETFGSLFTPTSQKHDFTELDKLMPHPIYGSMFWVCVLNPGSKTIPTVLKLLAEAYDKAVSRQAGKK